MSDRFVSPAPPPTAREREILELLIEECAEVTQRATKALRFGLSEVQSGQNLTNAERIAFEVGDVLEVVDMAVREGVAPDREIQAGRVLKRAKLRRFMQTTKEGA